MVNRMIYGFKRAPNSDPLLIVVESSDVEGNHIMLKFISFLIVECSVVTIKSGPLNSKVFTY